MGARYTRTVGGSNLQLSPILLGSIRRSVRQTASLVSGGRVREQMSGKWAANFKTRTIYWSPVEPDQPVIMADDRITFLIGHEASHLLYTGGYPWPAEITESERTTFHRFVNACEDVRIERLTGKRLPGFKVLRDDYYGTMINRLHPPNMVIGYSPMDQAWISFFRHEFGQEVKLPKKMKRWVKKNWPTFSDAANLNSTAEVAEAILPLYLELREMKQTGKVPDSPDGDGEGEPGDGEGGKGFLDKLIDKFSGDDAKGESDASGEGEGEGEANKGDEGEGEGSGGAQSLPTYGEMSEGDDDVQQGGDGISMGSGYNDPYRSDFDPDDDNRPGSIDNEYEKKGLLESIADDATLDSVSKALRDQAIEDGHLAADTQTVIDRMTGSVRTKIDDSFWSDRDAWDSCSVKHGQQIRSLAHRLRSKLRHNAMDAYEGGHKRGRLNSRKAYRAFMGDNHIYRQRREIGTSKYTVGLLVDTSSSMATRSGSGGERLIDVAVLAAEAIAMADIDLFIIPWSDHPHGVKTVRHPLASVRRFLGSQIGYPRGGTYEAPSLVLAEDQFARVHEGGKILITITDGETEWPDESREVLARLSEQGVIPIGVGLGFTPAHYPNALTFNDVDDFSRALPNLLDSLIKRGK